MWLNWSLLFSDTSKPYLLLFADKLNTWHTWKPTNFQQDLLIWEQTDYQTTENYNNQKITFWYFSCIPIFWQVKTTLIKRRELSYGTNKPRNLSSQGILSPMRRQLSHIWQPMRFYCYPLPLGLLTAKLQIARLPWSSSQTCQGFIFAVLLPGFISCIHCNKSPRTTALIL